MDKKRVVIAVGGTGGHIYPAVALARQLQNLGVEVELIGGGLATNPFANHAGIPRVEVAAGPLSGNVSLKSFLSVGKILKGTAQSSRLLRNFEPDAVVGFGSYHTFPVLMAARLRRIPIVLHEGNGIPGRVNRFFSKAARMTVVHMPQTARQVQGRSIVSRPLLREGYHLDALQKGPARTSYGLDPQKFTFLVTGGSQGALAINLLASTVLTEHLGQHSRSMQVIHLTGNADLADPIRQQYENHGIACVVKNFETHMERAYHAADLVIARAGAATIAELEEFELPALLIPFPHAMDAHQDANADFYVETVGGGIKLLESGLDAERLAVEIRRLITDDRRALRSMQSAIRSYKQKRPERDLCSVVCETIGVKLR